MNMCFKFRNRVANFCPSDFGYFLALQRTRKLDAITRELDNRRQRARLWKPLSSQYTCSIPVRRIRSTV